MYSQPYRISSLIYQKIFLYKYHFLNIHQIHALLYSQKHIQWYYFNGLCVYYDCIGFLYPHLHLSLFSFSFEVHSLASNLHAQLHKIRFIYVFVSFILASTLLNAFTFTSSVLFQIHILSDGSSITLKFPLHLFKLIING